jgi:hypothetical protein
MSPILVALFCGIGVAAFVYSKITRRTGGLTKNDVTIAGMAGSFAFLVMWSVMAMLMGN